MRYTTLRKALFLLDPERAHALGLFAARLAALPIARLAGAGSVAGLERTVAGIRFQNPIGLAAGLDKDGAALPFWRALGFGFVEFGTVTPRPQRPNPRPRLWRLVDDEALANNLGFPNAGAKALAQRLSRNKQPGDVIGINVGKNRETPLRHAAADLLAALEATRGVADYWTVNVSSPNTQGLRELQSRRYLPELLRRLTDAAAEVPLFVKISPDLSTAQLEEIAEVIASSGCAGVVATNTMEIPQSAAPVRGGLSGQPLAARARASLRTLRVALPRTPIISVGGIDGHEEVTRRLSEGAALVQLYTALVYQGPGLPASILAALAREQAMESGS